MLGGYDSKAPQVYPSSFSLVAVFCSGGVADWRVVLNTTQQNLTSIGRIDSEGHRKVRRTVKSSEGHRENSGSE